ncbi:MAG: DUF547 domain-containing protein [Deltaproteobacteria bacterium]|nr:DUF547 domain-containing protein [Deltaproteobacteria bacterium]
MTTQNRITVMNRRFVALIIAAHCALFSSSTIAFDKTHAKWAEVLTKYRSADSRIRYGQLKADLKLKADHPLLIYLQELGSVSRQEYDAWEKKERMAFLINAYNAFTVKLIADHYPVKSIKKVGGLFTNPWKLNFFSLLEGEIKNLDTIEHEYLRKQFQEPLIHAAINCASVSCPKLQEKPYLAANLTGQLESALKEFLSDPSRNRYEPASGKLFLSEIFKWFGDDFKSRFPSYLKAIEIYGPPAAKKTLVHGEMVEWIEYDWTLNDGL